MSKPLTPAETRRLKARNARLPPTPETRLRADLAQAIAELRAKAAEYGEHATIASAAVMALREEADSLRLLVDETHRANLQLTDVLHATVCTARRTEVA